jgi:hypothetical protein
VTSSLLIYRIKVGKLCGVLDIYLLFRMRGFEIFLITLFKVFGFCRESIGVTMENIVSKPLYDPVVERRNLTKDV